MKKYFYSMLAAATMLFVASCSQDDELTGSNSGEQTVSFTVQVPATTQTRAIADGVEVGKGNMANTLVYALYEKGKENETPLILGQKGEDSDGVFVITVPMAKDLTYELMMLAYNADNCAFDINYDADNLSSVDLQALQLKSSLSANQEAYDAFVGSETVSVNEEAVTIIKLKRPFAQVNAATTDADLADAATLKAVVTSSQLVINGVPTQYNVFTGEATGLQNLTYTDAAILYQTNTTSNEKITVDGTSYNYLTMAYVLAGETATSDKSTHNATFTFNREDGTTVSTVEISNLPIQRNYRTNVVGGLLTKTEGYRVVIDEAFEDDHIVSYWDGQTVKEPTVVDGAYIITSAPEFAWLSGKTLANDVVFAADIDMNNYTFKGMLSGGHALDGKGYTLSNVVLNYTTEGQDWSSLFVTGGGNGANSSIDVKNLTVIGANVIADKSKNGNAAVIASYAEGTVNIENVTVKNAKVNGTLNMGALVGIVTAQSETTIKNCVVEGAELNTFDLANESGNVGVVAGRVVGKLTVENTSVANSTINAYIGRDGQQRAVAKYIGNFYGDGANLVVTDGSIDNVTINVLSESNTDQVCIYGDFLGGWQNNGGTVTINGVNIEKSAGVISGAEAFNTALANAQVGDVIGFEGEIAITELKAGAAVTIVGMSEDATINATNDGQWTGCSGDITFKNLTIKLANNREHYNVGLHNQGGTHVYENCNFEGIATAWGNCTYNNCTFTNAVDGKYAAWVYAGTVVYNNCEFNGVDRAAKVFNENANSGLNVTYNDCTFKATGTNDDKTAVEVAVENNTEAATIVTINNATIENMKKAEHYGTEIFNIEYTKSNSWGNGIVTVDGETHAVVCKEAAISTVMGMNSKNITMNLCQDTELSNGTSTKWGGAATETVKIGSVSTDESKWTLTLSNSYRDYVQTNGAKVVMEKVKLASSENKGTHWHDYAPKFECDVEMTGVDMLNSFCFEKKAVLKDIKINCSWPNAVYALWVVAGADVTIDGADITSVRGIKITDENAPAEKTTLKVSNAKFTTTAKAAILATTKYGADIIVSDLDLSSVAADQTNAVWVDEERTDYFDLVNVSGGTKFQE